MAVAYANGPKAKPEAQHTRERKKAHLYCSSRHTENGRYKIVRYCRPGHAWRVALPRSLPRRANVETRKHMPMWCMPTTPQSGGIGERCRTVTLPDVTRCLTGCRKEIAKDHDNMSQECREMSQECRRGVSRSRASIDLEFTKHQTVRVTTST